MWVSGWPTSAFLSAPWGGCPPARLLVFSSRRRHTRCLSGWSSDVCSSDLIIIIIDRISVYNVRFGRGVGDKVLQFFADYLVQSLPSEAPPFRWSGPSVLMLRPGTAEQATPIIRRVLEQRVEYEVELAARTILLPIAARWEVVPLMADPRLVVNKIDSVVACQGVPGLSRTREH